MTRDKFKYVSKYVKLVNLLDHNLSNIMFFKNTLKNIKLKLYYLDKLYLSPNLDKFYHKTSGWTTSINNNNNLNYVDLIVKPLKTKCMYSYKGPVKGHTIPEYYASVMQVYKTTNK